MPEQTRKTGLKDAGRFGPLPTLTCAVSMALGGALLGATGASAETLSNRHHLTQCAPHSVPVLIPHTTHSTVRLNLPVETGTSWGVDGLAGDSFTLETERRRRGTNITGTSGAAFLSPAPAHC